MSATKHGDLTQNVVATVTLDNHDGTVTILRRGGAAADVIWLTFNGQTPTAAGDDCYVVASTPRRFSGLPVVDTGALTVKMLTTSTGVSYSIEGAL